MAAAADEVFAAIRDPAVLLAVIPGCTSVDRVGEDEYVGVLTLRLPGAVGRFRTWVRVVDAVAPERAGLDGRVEGVMGSIAGHADLVLADRPGGTRLAYRGRAMIEGPLARLDSRFVESLADSLVSQGLRALDARLAGTRTPPGPAVTVPVGARTEEAR